jgi:DNA polymerase-4
MFYLKLNRNLHNRSIFHIRCKDFAIQAERLTDSRLRTRAVAIISSNHQQGTVVSLSDEARQEGLRKGMKVSLVRKMNHSVLLLPCNERLYESMNQYIYQTISSYSPVVEPSCFGQYYVDMTGMGNIYPSNKKAGNLILRGIHDKVNLASTLGISANKLVSSVSTLVVPEPLYEVNSGYEPQFMAPQSSYTLPVVREKLVKQVVEFIFLKKVLDIQKILKHPDTAALLFGKFHRQLDLQAHGEDYSAVVAPRVVPHITRQKILKRDTNDTVLLEAVVQTLAEQIGFELRQRNRVARSLCLEIHYSDGFKNARKGSTGLNDDKSLTVLCLDLFAKTNYRRNSIRSILVDATNLQPAVHQLDMFDSQNEQSDTLSKAIDKIRTRFGDLSIQSASSMVA